MREQATGQKLLRRFMNHLRDRPDAAFYHAEQARKSAPGLPDLIAVTSHPAAVWFAEFKSRWERLSAAQKHWAKLLRMVEALAGGFLRYRAVTAENAAAVAEEMGLSELACNLAGEKPETPPEQTAFYRELRAAGVGHDAALLTVQTRQQTNA